MLTNLTNYKIPDAILDEAAKRANETGKTHYLAYLHATKDEPLTIVTIKPSIGLVAIVEPETKEQ